MQIFNQNCKVRGIDIRKQSEHLTTAKRRPTRQQRYSYKLSVCNVHQQYRSTDCSGLLIVLKPNPGYVPFPASQYIIG